MKYIHHANGGNRVSDWQGLFERPCRFSTTRAVPKNWRGTFAEVLSATLLMFLLAVTAGVAHAQDGLPLWTNRYQGSAGGADSVANALVVDTNGNVFVTGSAPLSIFGGVDYVTMKISSGGVGLWTNTYDAGVLNNDSALAIALDGGGNVIVTGFSIYGDQDFLTVKYSNAGAGLWTNRYDGGNGDDIATAVVADKSGNVVITGSSRNGKTDADDNDISDLDIATIKYSSTGAPVWTNIYDGGFGDDVPVAVKVDTNGNVFVAGTMVSDTNGHSSYVTIKYSSAGTPLWTNFCGRSDGFNQAKALGLDCSGNVFVTGGAYNDFANNSDVGTVKYSNVGAPMWTNRYDGGSFDYGNALAVDNGGNVLVTGQTTSPDFNNEYITLKYSNAGALLWTNLYDGVGPVFGFNAAYAIAVDTNGNVFVGGASYASNPNVDPDDYATLKYSGAGVPLWTNRFKGGVGGGYGYDGIVAMGTDPGGNAIVTGHSLNQGYFQYATIKYSGPSGSGSSPATNAILAIVNIGSQVVLTWTNAGFGLQSAPMVTGTYTNIIGATSPYTNPITGSQRYFRLSE